jgi:hypothetical protein
MSTSSSNTPIVGGVLIALLGFNIALLASRTQLPKWLPATLLRQATPEAAPPTSAQYGKQLSADFLRLLDANAAARAKHRFVLLVSTPDFRAIEYLRVIGEKYKESIVPTIVSTSALDEAPAVNPSAIVVPDWPTKTGLRLGQVNNLLLVVDDQGMVEFVAYGIPDIDVLRQLAEKYAKDSIEYQGTELGLQRVFAPGQPIPRIEVVRLASPSGTLSLAEVLPGGGRLFVITARCNACQISKFFLDIARLLRDSAAANIATAVLITEPGIGLEELTPALVAPTIAENAFAVARGNLFYDPVTTRIAETSDRPFVVDIARDHTITNVRILQAGS